MAEKDAVEEVKKEDKKTDLDSPKTYNSAAEELAAIELSIKRAQLEDLKLQKQEREYNMRDLRQRLGEREVKELQKQEDRAAQGRTFANQKAADEARQSACTHRKGGVVSPRDLSALSTGGNSDKYAVLKHQMINADIWVRCLRCGKTWVPPMKENFYLDAQGKKAPHSGKEAGTFSKSEYDAAWVKYREAVAFPTNNTMSGSVQCKFSKYNEEIGEWVDASAEYRAQLKNTNLR